MTPQTPHYSENHSAFPLEGGCACGQIRYRLEQAPLVVNCCHCTSCQRETGTAFAINIIIESASVTSMPPAPAATAPAHPSDPDHFPPTGPEPPRPPPTSPSAVAAAADAVVAAPTAVCVPSESLDGVAVAHCPTCLVAVWSDYGSCSLLRWVRGGTLDRPWLVAPDVHIFMRSKREFVTVADGKPQFEQRYKFHKVWRKESRERYERVRVQMQAAGLL